MQSIPINTKILEVSHIVGVRVPQGQCLPGYEADIDQNNLGAQDMYF